MKRRSFLLLVAFLGVGLLVAGGGAIVVLTRTSSGSTTGQSVNAAIDNLSAFGIRLLELPLILLLLAGAVMAVVLALPVMWLGTVKRRVTLGRIGAASIAGLVLLGLAVAADRKFEHFQTELADLRGTLNHERLSRLQAMSDQPEDPGAHAALEPPSDPLVPGATAVTVAPSTAAAPAAPPVPTTVAAVIKPTPAPSAPTTAPAATTKAAASGKRTTLMVDKAALIKSLTGTFGTVNAFPVIHDQATDIVEVDMPQLPAIAYMAVVDLKTPGLEVKFGGSLTQKTLTTDFAKANNCQIAINGEAGASPQANSGLGVWRGNMMSAGTLLMKEDPANRRPFLTFDKQSHATFTAMAAGSRAVPADAYNVIWGRLDAIIDGKVQTENERDRQPRTAMGVSNDGKLYLMVVDGRQQGYSVGFTRAEVGAFLQAFGATDGMLCDEGGSSCIYMKKMNGIVNSPSDGVERVTYTHFGIALTAN